MRVFISSDKKKNSRSKGNIKSFNKTLKYLIWSIVPIGTQTLSFWSGKC